MAFDELNDSSGSFQDMDDVTLDKLLTEAHQGQADYCVPGGMSVSQSVCHRQMCSMDQGNVMEREMSINQLILVSQETRIVFTATFLKTSKLREWSIDQGNLMGETAQTHSLGLHLKTKDRPLPRNNAEKSVITNSMHLTQKKSANFYEKNYDDRK